MVSTDPPTRRARSPIRPRSRERRRKASIPAALLENNDSYHFFQPLEALIQTGPTGTNVMDVRLMLIP